MTTAPKWASTLLDLIDGTPLRRVVFTKPRKRTQSDRMRKLRTMRAEMREGKTK